MTANGIRSRIVVMDPRKLRQAGLVRLLEGWAEANNLEIVATASLEDRPVWPDCAMVVVSTGGASVLDEAPQLWIKSVKAFMSEVPVVILSDREDCGEVRAAFRAGVSGFIPTSLEPALAIEALTFLSRGGSFFPCSVLLEESQAVREETSRALREERYSPEPEQGELAVPDRQAYAISGRSQTPRPEQQEYPAARPQEPSGPERRSYSEIRRSRIRISARRSLWDSPPGGPEGNGEQQPPSLTPRQREVLERLSEGKSNKLIARDLDMTEATVKVHVRQIMRKFGAANRTQAALCAMRFASVSMVRRSR